MNSKPALIIFCSVVPMGTPPHFILDFAKELSKKEKLMFIDLPTTSNKPSFQGFGKCIISFIKLSFGKDNFVYTGVNDFLSLQFFKIFISFRKKMLKNKIVFVTTTATYDPIYDVAKDVFVFDCSDRYPNEFENNKERIAQFDLVFANTQFIYNQLVKMSKKVYLISSGYCKNVLSRRLVIPKIKNSVVFFGGISHRIDYKLLNKVISRLPNKVFVFIGEMYLNKYYVDEKDNQCLDEWKRILKMPNVIYWNKINMETAKLTIPLFEIGIIPYETADFFNHNSNPIKLFEYLGHGLPVVSTRLPNTFCYVGKYPVSVAGSVDVFIDKIKTSRKIDMHFYKKKIDKLLISQSLETKTKQFLSFVQGFRKNL